MITLGKVKQIQEVVDKYIKVMSYMVTGDNKPSKEVLESINLKEKEPIINLFYKYGKAEMLDNISVKSKSTEELYKLMQHTGLSETDKKALLYIKINSLNAIASLQENITNQVVNEITKDDIKEVFIKNIDATNSSSIAKKLEDLTSDYTKNWKSIAHTELWNAKIYGQAVSILENSKDGIETKVYKKVEENACKHCKKHYLNKDGSPKIFTLKELIENGSNYGKKVADWKAVLGTMHPNCMCRLVVASSTEITPSLDLIKSDDTLTSRKVDKTKLRYEKRMVDNHGIVHEQGFWVKDKEPSTGKDAKAQDDNSKDNGKVPDAKAQGYSGEPKMANQKAVGAGKTNPVNVNIAGMNQHNGADIGQEPQTIQVTQGDKDIELPVVPFAALPDKRKKYFGSILGFDYGTALSLKYIYGKKAALKYLEETGFNVQVEDTEKSWNNAWNEISQYLSISNSPNSKKDYTNQVFDVLRKESKWSNEGDYARLVNKVTGDLYPTLGVYDYDKDKVVGIVTQVGDKFYGTNGANSLDDIFSRWLRGKASPLIPLVPVDLKKDPKNDSLGNWFFNEIKVQSADVEDKHAKEILKKIVRELTGKKADLED